MADSTKRNGIGLPGPLLPRNIGTFILLRELSVLGNLLFPSRNANGKSRAIYPVGAFDLAQR